MAPTTLMGQKTATSPYGAPASPAAAQGLRSSSPAWTSARRARRPLRRQEPREGGEDQKAIRLQVESKGFSFVEVLAECPTHLRMTPVETEKWVKERWSLYPSG
jgi:pyruvate/2-oxoacid:ferredoxin oxidoreductase beta subunit